MGASFSIQPGKSKSSRPWGAPTQRVWLNGWFSTND